MLDSVDTAYYVAQAVSGREYFARNQLDLIGVDTFIPECREVVRHARTVRERIVPMFPGYLFIHLHRDDVPWRAIATTPGVVAVLSSRLGPTPVPRPVMAELKNRVLDGGGSVRVPDPTDFYEPGQPMRITEGTFTGLPATFLKFDGDKRNRVSLLLDIMGRAVQSSFPIDIVEPATA